MAVGIKIDTKQMIKNKSDKPGQFNGLLVAHWAGDWLYCQYDATKLLQFSNFQQFFKNSFSTRSEL